MAFTGDFSFRGLFSQSFTSFKVLRKISYKLITVFLLLTKLGMSLLPLLRRPRCIDRFMAKRHCRMDSRSSTWNLQPVTQQGRSRLCFVGFGCVSSQMHFWVISSKRSQISKSDSRRLFLDRKTSKYQLKLPKHQVVFFTSQAPTHFQSHLVYPFFRNAWNKPMSIVGKKVPNGNWSPKKIVFQKRTGH